MAKHATYDPKVIQNFADLLYAQANTIIALCTLVALSLGSAGGYMLPLKGDIQLVATGVGAVLFGVVGYILGQGIAFRFKLQAQIALCQVQIEQNSRGKLPA